MLPSQIYQHLCELSKIQADPDQQKLVIALDELLPSIQKTLQQKHGFLDKLRAFFKPMPVSSLYLYGDVGRGKTFLVDLLLESLVDLGVDKARIRRQHFHRFMQMIHDSLAQTNDKDPLPKIVDAIGEQCDILFLDEFLVEDITDAMILSEILKTLKSAKIVLLTTSNTAPKNLYRNGLQRDRFLPAIAWLEKHTHIISLDAKVDFRLQYLHQHQAYLVTAEPDARAEFANWYQTLTLEQIPLTHPLKLGTQVFEFESRTENTLHVKFEKLCEAEYAARDYVLLAESYPQILLEGLPLLDDSKNDAVKRFMHFIDAVYDAKVKLVLLASAPIESIYQGQAQPGFRRTESRLQEMQSTTYWQRVHTTNV